MTLRRSDLLIYNQMVTWTAFVILAMFKLHMQLQSKDDNVDPHSGYTSCRNTKDPKKKESLHLSGPPLLPPGHVRRQPKKVWQSTQYLVVNNVNMMFSLQAKIYY